MNEVSLELQKRIMQETDLEMLGTWLKVSADVKTIAELEEKINVVIIEVNGK